MPRESAHAAEQGQGGEGVGASSRSIWTESSRSRDDPQDRAAATCTAPEPATVAPEPAHQTGPRACAQGFYGGEVAFNSRSKSLCL
jgi:hypothetical protein